MKMASRASEQAREWTDGYLMEWLCDLCAAFGQETPTIIRADDAYLRHLRKKRIECDKPVDTCLAVGWVASDEIDWRELRIPYSIAGVTKYRPRTDAERVDYIRAVNKGGTRKTAQDGWQWHVRTAAGALADDVLRAIGDVDGMGAVRRIVGDNFVEISYAVPWPGTSWWLQTWRHGWPCVGADTSSCRRVFCAPGSVEVCVVPARADSMFGARTRVVHSSELLCGPCVNARMVQHADGFALVMRPRKGGRFAAIRDDREHFRS